MLASLVAAIALIGAPRTPTLCVQLAAPQIEVKSLIVALSARIARQQVRVVRCGSDGAGTWRLIAVPSGVRGLQLILSGPELSIDRVVEVTGMSSEELVQFIALTVAETIRPSLDAWLGRFEALPPPEEAPPPAPACPEVPKCPDPAPPPLPREVRVEVPAEARGSVAILAAPMLATGGPDVSAYLELFGGAQVGQFRFILHGGLNVVPTQTVGAASISLIEIEAGASILYAWSAVSAGLRVNNRLTFAQPSGGFSGDEGQLFWNGGFALTADVEIWRAGPVVIGAAARAWLWPEPHRYLDAGVPILTQSYLEVAVGPYFAFSPPDNF